VVQLSCLCGGARATGAGVRIDTESLTYYIINNATSSLTVTFHLFLYVWSMGKAGAMIADKYKKMK
jgi:hypothetical protein